MIGFTIPSREPVPPITHPLGRGWRQPDLARIVFERGVAFMDARTFAELGEYSTSLPTGVYEGKIWKRERLIWQREGAWRHPVGTGEWFLCWFDESPRDPDACRTRSVPLRVLA